MIRPVLLLLLASLALSACAAAPGSTPAPGAATLAITHVTVIDATGAPPRPDQTVLVGGGRILRIGPAGRVDVPAGARVVDGAGKWLVPGLWDMHAHAWQRAVFEPLFFAAGITGFREMGTGIDPLYGARTWVWSWRDSIRSGAAPGPRMAAAGVILNGGDPSQAPAPFFQGVPTPEAGRRWVDSLAARGADFVKVYSALAPEVFHAIVRRARERGLPVAGHVPHRVGTRAAAAAGLRSIEHLYDVQVSASADEAAIRREIEEVLATTTTPGAAAQLAEARLTDRLIATWSPAKADSLYRALVRAGTWVTPTLAVAADPRCPGSPVPLPDSARLAGIPAFLRPFVQLRDTARADVERGCRRLARLVAIVGEMHRAGVPILAGSDAPNPGVVPGIGLHQELELLVAAGLTPLQALQAATVQPARFLGMADSLGTVQAGRRADLVLLGADPLADIRNTRAVRAVVMNGRLVFPWAPEEGQGKASP